MPDNTWFNTDYSVLNWPPRNYTPVVPRDEAIAILVSKLMTVRYRESVQAQKLRALVKELQGAPENQLFAPSTYGVLITPEMVITKEEVDGVFERMRESLADLQKVSRSARTITF